MCSCSDEKNKSILTILDENYEELEIFPIKLGDGKCYEPWCECKEYEDIGYGDLCANCGHQYSQHG